MYSGDQHYYYCYAVVISLILILEAICYIEYGMAFEKEGYHVAGLTEVYHFLKAAAAYLAQAQTQEVAGEKQSYQTTSVDCYYRMSDLQYRGDLYAPTSQALLVLTESLESWYRKPGPESTQWCQWWLCTNQ
ncbi:hypothetical protein EDD17DRAFT_1503833 [Pisolithus thermaeus]|nr:hypothetical protein EDD17DRAFT_1503833 [Pisolithus thermaeus]